MFIHLEKNIGTSILRQITDQIRAQCAGGKLQPGDRLPATRALSLQLGVNQNTIHRAYDRLAAEGLLERRNGEGTFVAASAASLQLDTHRNELRQEIARLIQRSIQLGLEPNDFLDLLDEALASHPSEPIQDQEEEKDIVGNSATTI